MPFTRQSGQTARARQLRKQENPAEASMWTILRNRQLNGHKFVRQLPIGPYYTDFACRSSKLVLEIDGSQHVDNASDERRDRFLVQQGYTVLRIPSHHVLRNRRIVCDTILAALEGRITENLDTLDMKYTRPSSVSLRSPPSPVNGRSE